MFKIEESYHDEDSKFYFLVIGGVVLAIGTAILCILGTYGFDGGEEPNPYHHPAIGQCLYVGLPIIWSLALYIGCMFFFEYPSKTPVFRKKGFVWDKLPYAIWGMISCVECLVLGISRIIFPFLIIWVVPYYCVLHGYKLITYGYKLGVKALRTIYVAFTIPDGKAETRIHAIWTNNKNNT
jgi:hypothetical protein